MSINALKETAKSFLRFVYFGLLGLVGTFIASLISSADLQNTVINIGDTYIPVGVAIVAILTGLVKLIDRYVRENENNTLKGIAPGFLQR